MKKKYPGLSTRRIVVEGQPLMEMSKQKMKAKTKNEDWRTEDVDVDMGLDNMTISDTPIAP